MSNLKTTITFVIPCYNCSDTIKKKYKNLISKIRELKLNYQIILINDGSTDSTLIKLKSIKNNNLLIINNKKNLGKSKSIINSLKYIKSEKVLLIDCDLPYFEKLTEVIDNLNLYDLVITNRRVKKFKIIMKNSNLYELIRKIIGYLIGLIIEFKLDLKVNGDTQAGLKAFKLSPLLLNKRFISKYYFFDLELIKLFRKNNLKIKSISVKHANLQKSSIKLFAFKNVKILFEFLRVLFNKE